VVLEVRERASRALSMPVALREGAGESESNWASRDARSGPRGFLAADLEADLGVVRWDFSSSARRASRSAFLLAASAFLFAASSL